MTCLLLCNSTGLLVISVIHRTVAMLKRMINEDQKHFTWNVLYFGTDNNTQNFQINIYSKRVCGGKCCIQTLAQVIEVFNQSLIVDSMHGTMLIFIVANDFCIF